MARGVNKVIIIGNVGQDPDVRFLQSGNPVCNLRIATSDSWIDKQSGQRQERTEWHSVVLFNKLAEIAQQYVHKGSRLYIEGRLQTRKWQGQDGQDRYATEIVAGDMQMLDSRSGDQQQSQQGSYQPQQPAQQNRQRSQQAQQPQQYQPQQPNQYAQQSGGTATPQHGAPQGFDDFDDEIPF